MADSPNHIAVSDDFVEDSLDRQLYVFQNSDNKSAYVRIHSERWEKMMAQVVTICEDRLLKNAGTYSLNEIGKQLNMTRYTDDNEVFRTAIMMREQAATKSTTRTNIVDLIAEVFDTDTDNVYISTWNNRVDIILLDVCITSTSAIEEIKRLLPILTRYTIGTKTNGIITGIGSLQEFRDEVDSDGVVYTLNNAGTLGCYQEFEEQSDGTYRDDTWGYMYQIESEIL